MTVASNKFAIRPRMLFDRRTAILVAIFPILVLALINHVYMREVFDLGLGWFYFVDALRWVAIPLCIWIFILEPNGIRLQELGFTLRLPGGTPSVFAGDFVVAVVLLSLAYEPVLHIAHRFLWRYASSFGYRNTIPQSFPWNAIAIIYLSSTTALIEESVFRGLLWSYFDNFSREYNPRFWYVALTSLLFAAVHSSQGPAGVIAAFSMGLAASLLYLHFRNLWPLVFGHFVIDVHHFWPSSG